jgi:hypothetical protein
MSSYLIIDFDTTSPQIEIYAPRYTTKDVVNEIVVQSNEELANHQEVYAIDSIGVRHDYTFQQEQNDQFVGLIRFNDFPYGIATIYARMKDEVDNYSDLVYKSIEIKESFTSLNLKINDKDRLMDEMQKDRKTKIKDMARNISVNNKLKRKTTIRDTSRKIDTKDKRGG